MLNEHWTIYNYIYACALELRVWAFYLSIDVRPWLWYYIFRYEHCIRIKCTKRILFSNGSCGINSRMIAIIYPFETLLILFLLVQCSACVPKRFQRGKKPFEMAQKKRSEKKKEPTITPSTLSVPHRKYFNNLYLLIFHAMFLIWSVLFSLDCCFYSQTACNLLGLIKNSFWVHKNATNDAQP